MGSTDVVVAKRLHQLQALFNGARVGCRSQCAECMVIGKALEQHFLSVDAQAVLWRKRDGSHAEGLRYLVEGLVLTVVDRDDGGVKVRTFTRPELWMLKGYRVQRIFTLSPAWRVVEGLFVLGNGLSGLVNNRYSDGQGFCLSFVEQLRLNAHLSVVNGCDE